MSVDRRLLMDFLRASQAGDAKEVGRLCRQVDVDWSIEIDGIVASAMYLAAGEGHLECVLQLLNAQADPTGKAENHKGRSPLYMAAAGGHFDVVDALVQAQVETNLQAEDGETALYASVQQGHVEILELLANAQADLNCPDDFGLTPLHVASSHNQADVVRLLLQAGASPDSVEVHGGTALHLAAQSGSGYIAKTLIHVGHADVNMMSDSGLTALFLAAQENHSEVANVLIGAQCDPNIYIPSSGQSPLYVASQNGHSHMVDLLISAQADVSAMTRAQTTPVYIATQNGHHDIVEALIQSGANLDCQQSQGASPLYIAAQKGHRRILDALIRAQANPELRAMLGECPLFIAAQMGHEGVVAELIRAQTNLDLPRVSGLTPIAVAAQNGHMQSVEALVKAKADVNSRSNLGFSPLHIAAQFGHLEVMKILINGQADKYLKSDNGSSPMTSAAYLGNCSIVTELLNSGAEMDAENLEEFSAVQAAVLGGRSEVLELLVEHGIRIPEMVFTSLINLMHTNCLNQPKPVEFQLGRMLIREKEIASSHRVDEPVLSNSTHKEAFTEEELGRRLHLSLKAAGFTNQRAILQAAIADVLQDIQRKRVNYLDTHVVGSYSEGWGNSLKCVNGITDSESDIDITRIEQGRLFHLKGFCECLNPDPDATVLYQDGHILCSGYSDKPAEGMYGSAMRPAIDRVSAYRVCCYPTIAPLQPDRVSGSNILQYVLKALQHELSISPCHVVHASAPRQAGKQLRVSTTFLEKLLLRSLTTLQGHLFVILKYLIKKVICGKNGYNLKGLKSYHAKTITFRMLEKTPAEQWKPENLTGLIKQSLQMLHDDAASSLSKPDRRLMEHFFLCDTALYLKGGNQSSSLEIAKVVQKTVDNLPQHITGFISTLTPISSQGIFYFHPFMILHRFDPNPMPDLMTYLEYHEIYDVVREALVVLALDEDTFMWKRHKHTETLGRLPDSAKTAREVLIALTHLKCGQLDSAIEVLSSSLEHEVSRGIVWNPNFREEATENFVRRHLEASDSAWKFAMEFPTRPRLDFVTNFIEDSFPSQLENYNCYFYINFDALKKVLCLELAVESTRTGDWFQEVLDREDSDDQDLLMVIEFCDSVDLLAKIIQKFRAMIVGGALEKLIAQKLLHRPDYPEIVQILNATKTNDSFPH